ncbi:MAG: glycosyltransferase family 4 protein [Alcanivorax sp.]
MAEHKDLKVAIIHDWLPLIAGAERVLEQIVQVYPDADIYTLFDFLDDEQRKTFGDCKITASYLNKWPKVEKYYRKLLPFCPMAIEDFDLSEYDLIISSSHAVAKGVITGAEQIHVSYVHSPTRYAWDLMHHYLKESNMDRGIKGYIAKKILHKFRIWDYRTANGVDSFIANSNYIRKRIWKVYRRDAEVIYPPVNVDLFEYSDQKEDFYLTASRMVPYKRLDLIASAFALLPDLKLKIIGDGPEMSKIKAIADKSPNIEIMGFQPTDVLRDHMQRAKAFVFAAEEDFGIIPVEAQACGTPVVAYGAGGALETVIDYRNDKKNATGTFFEKQTPECVADTIKRFEAASDDIDYKNCRINAEKFAPEKFRNHIKETVNKALEENKS